MSKSCYLFVNELAFISDRLRHVFDRSANGSAARISFKEIQQFQKQLRTWDTTFAKPPMPLVAACNVEMLGDFYRHKLDFSIFEEFNMADRDIIQEEIASYVTREALDSLIGYRLRNWAAIGVLHPKWAGYRDLVQAYYERIVSIEKREKIDVFEQTLAQTTGQTPERIHVRCVGELFFEVDRIRLMSSGVFERHLENIRLQATGRRLRREHQPLEAPESLRKCFQLFGFTRQVDFDELKERYRQLALNYHPDKGGSLEMMQRINTAYRQIADHLRQVEGNTYVGITS